MAGMNDDLVLEAIFNPNLPGIPQSDSAKDCDESAPDEEIESNLLSKVKELEIEGVNAAESGDFEKSLQMFNNAINLAPTHASSFNNRAQLYRLKGDINAALQDIDTAITLSKGHGKAAAQAFTQRAIIKKLQQDQEGAYQDFKLAASLGNTFAKSQAVQMNPYAALCNQMLRETIAKLKKGECNA